VTLSRQAKDRKLGVDVRCDACDVVGRLEAGQEAPKGWFFARMPVNFSLGRQEDVVVLTCSELCKVKFWQGGSRFKTLEEVIVDFLGRHGHRLERVEDEMAVDGESAWRLRMGTVGTAGSFLQCVRLAFDALWQERQDRLE
jgi:hypothetical protein